MCVCVCVCVVSVNVGCGQAEERVLLTGLHAVADIYCECCKTTLGWKYVSTLTVSVSVSRQAGRQARHSVTRLNV